MGQCNFNHQQGGLHRIDSRLSQHIDITVVVPVYNSVETLEPLYNRTVETLTRLGKTFEVLFVEDGGVQESWDVLTQLKDNYGEHVTVIRLGRNYGQNAATVCGIIHAKGQAVITIDDDLQTPPEEIEKLLNHHENTEDDIVFGIVSVQNSPIVRRIGSELMKRMFRWADGAEIGSSFRYISSTLKSQLVQQAHDKLFLNQVVHWYTDKVGKIEVVHEPRQEGKSGYSLFGLIGMGLRLMFYYTDLPLRLMSLAGFIIAFVCFGFGVFYIHQKLVVGAEAGFASIITAIFFATGVIMICISILGAYISRIYTDRNNRPVYSVKTIL